MFFRHPLLTRLGVNHGFGSLAGSLEGEDFRGFRQVHGTRIVQVSGSKPSLSIEADGGWTRDPSVTIAVFTADCLPILLSSPGGHVVAAIHAGWRGAVRGIVPEGVRCLTEAAGCTPKELTVVIGPSIRDCCYPVGPEVWTEIVQSHPMFRQAAPEDGRLNLPSLVRHQLESIGIPPSGIGILDLCTACHPELFFSHRAMGSARKSRNMLNYIRCSP
ncbi:MAG: peptidoglycan editing factor PgeF [Leptospirales bacterium]